VSAFTVGKQSATTGDVQGEKTSRIPEDEGPGAAFIKWIPGDAIVFYTALLAIGAKQPPLVGTETPDQILERVNVNSWSWFLFALVTTGLLVIVGARNNGVKDEGVAIGPLLARIVLTLIAFLVWSTLLPGSWSYSWHIVRDMGDAYVLVIGVVAIVFTAVAERFSRAVDRRKVKETAAQKAQRDSAKAAAAREAAAARI